MHFLKIAESKYIQHIKQRLMQEVKLVDFCRNCSYQWRVQDIHSLSLN